MYQVSDKQFKAAQRLIAAVLFWKAEHDVRHRNLFRAMGDRAPAALDALGQSERTLYREVQTFEAATAAVASVPTGYPAEASR